MEFKIKHKIWMESNGTLLMGKGHALLLRALLTNPSLSEVARQQEISYSKAWKMMKHLNQSAAEPVVQMISGGKKGGQTSVTPYGKKLLEHFWQTHQQYELFLNGKINKNTRSND